MTLLDALVVVLAAVGLVLVAAGSVLLSLTTNPATGFLVGGFTCLLYAVLLTRVVVNPNQAP